ENGPKFLLAWTALSILCAIVPLPFTIPAHIVLDDKRIAQTRATAIVALSRLHRPLSAHVFVRAMFDVQKQVRAAAELALTGALQTISNEQYGTHNRELVPLLCKLLRPELERWHLPVVDALGKI